MNGSKVYAERLRELQAQMAQMNVDLLAIAPTPNMRYLLGFSPVADERPCALLVQPESTYLVVPELNADEMESRTEMSAIRWSDAEGPDRAFRKALEGLQVGPNSVLAADDTMRTDMFLFLQEIVEPSHSYPASMVISPLRMRKSKEELDALQVAAEIADTALMAGVEACRAGTSERDVAEAISSSFKDQHVDTVDFTIVGSGPNGAFPHHLFSDRKLQEGDMIVLDIGATVNGYHSDITRMVHLGDMSAKERSVCEIVLAANASGREAAVAGALARDVDRAARRVIEDAGYGPQFLHRTGHGLGLEVHEPPWITAESDTVLEPNMVFSVEPGIYLQEQFGVRIEDIVRIDEQGNPQCFSNLEREPIIK